MNYLRAEVALVESGALARREAEECAAMMLLGPVSAAEAYGRFGLLLGLLPPAAIFWRAFGYGTEEPEWVPLFVAMNVVCCLVGRKAGSQLGGRVFSVNRTITATILLSLLVGFIWGALTGSAGGALCFGFGAIPGAFMAVLIALICFPAFALLHRGLARGGMIEGRVVWPLAGGVPAVVAAAILGT